MAGQHDRGIAVRLVHRSATWRCEATQIQDVGTQIGDQAIKTSLLHRIQTAVDTLTPLVNREVSYPYFSPFVIPDVSILKDNGDWDPAMVHKVASGTKMVKALLNFQILIKILHHSFPYSSRSQVPILPSVNVFDYYVRLIKSLGPLSGSILAEQTAISNIIPSNWNPKKGLGAGTGAASGSRAGGDELSINELLSGSWAAGDQNVEVYVKPPTPDERSTVQFQNYDEIRAVLHNFVPSTYPFFQTIGKSLLPRRSSPDVYSRARHLTIAEALADTVLEQLRSAPKNADRQYLVIMLQSVYETLVDSTSRGSDRMSVQLTIPVLVAFREHGGIETLNSMLERFTKDIVDENSSDSAPSGEESQTFKVALAAVKKILEIYGLIVNGKNVHDSFGQINMAPRHTERSKEYEHQLIVELRMLILPVVRRLWDDEQLIKKAPTEVLSSVIDILKTIMAADQESTAYRKSDKSPPPSVFKNRETIKFNWAAHTDQLKNLTGLYNEDLAREAVYRTNGKTDDAQEYCRAHAQLIAGLDNPVPEEDAFQALPSPKPAESSSNASVFPAPELLADPMALDTSMPELNRMIGDVIGLGEDSSEESDSDSPETTSQNSPGPEGVEATAAVPVITKEDLDKERSEFQENLIDRCLETVAAHPDAVFEVSDLINNTVLKTDNEQKRSEVGEIVANSLMSLTALDAVDMKAQSQTITAYAHLLSILLQQPPFFKTTLPTLKEQEHISQYLNFLKLPPGGSNEELPPWIPSVLLIFEILLSDDSQPVEVQWKPPANENEPVEQPVWVEKDLSLTEEHRGILLAALLDILPRIGKEESLAVSILRILVILTRDHTVAKTIGEKKNLQRLFVMAKQLCSGGAGRLKHSRISDSIMIILRHITEDEDTIRQLMKTEILQFVSNNAVRNNRPFDVANYLRHLSHVALRAPKIFIEATTELLKLNRWTPQPIDGPPRSYSLALKDEVPDPAAPPMDGSVEPAVQATEDLTINDVKPSTESTDKDMTDAPKTPVLEMKRPVLENPDGVIHFLLCELLNYREVDDKEPPSQPSKDSKANSKGSGESPTPGPDAASSSGDEQSSEAKEKDKKLSKPIFKTEDHPIFVYRCFLLNCLTELLKSFTRSKVEFINFKRSAPVQTNTPIKPRSSVLNYLLNDVLCYPNSSTLDPVVVKKKAATSQHAQNVLVALVTRTVEKPLDRSTDNFEYDDEPDLLFVRRFVLDTVLRAYKEAAVTGEPFEVRYQRMISLAELMSQMIGEKDRDSATGNMHLSPSTARSQAQLKRLMYEKGYLAALTASIAEIDLTSPHVKRAIKYILRVLRSLTKTAYLLSHSDVLPAVASDTAVEDEIMSSSSLSDVDDDREETPDLYRNSTLGLLEPGRDDDEFSEGSHDGTVSAADEDDDNATRDILTAPDDDDMYDDEAYEDELDYGDEMSQDGEDNPSDEDEDLGEMGEIEGLPGDPGVVEVIMNDDDEMDDDDEDMDEDDEDDEGSDDDDDDDDVDSDDMDELEDRIEIVDEEGNAIEDDGNSGWESDTDEDDEEGQEELDYEAEAQDLHEAQIHGMHEGSQMANFPQIIRAAMNGEEIDGEDVLRELDDQHYVDDGEDDGMVLSFPYNMRCRLIITFTDEGEEDDMDDDDLYPDHDFPRKLIFVPFPFWRHL